MMHRIIHRQCTGCYKLLANRFHHICRGGTGTRLRNATAVLTKQEPKQKHGLLDNIKVLQRIDLRCFEGTSQEGEEDQKRVAMVPSNLQTLIKDDADHLSLWLGFDDEHITKEDILAFTEDIEDVYLVKKSGKAYCFLKFATEEIADKNYKIFNERKDMVVQYRGPKKTKVEREKTARSIWLGNLNPDITEEELYNMSPDIFKVSLIHRPSGERFAYLEFPSEKMAGNNFKKIKEENPNIAVAFKLDKERGAINRQLWLNNVDEDVTTEDIMKLSDDILEVTFGTGVAKNRYAHLLFGTEEEALKTYTKFKKQDDFKWNVRIAGKQSDDACVLVLFGSDPDWTSENFWNLSEDIIEVDINRKQDKETLVFLEFLTPEKTREAYRQLKKKGFTVFPRTGKGKEIRDRTLYVEQLQPEMTEETLMEMYPEILTVKIFTSINGVRHAILEYQTELAAVDAYKHFNQNKTMAVSFRGNKSQDFRKRSLWLGNLADDIVEWDLYRFSRDIIKVILQTKLSTSKNGNEVSKKSAIVEYASTMIALRNFDKLMQTTEILVKRLSEDINAPILWLNLTTEWTRASLRDLSPDIGAVEIHQRSNGSEYAFLHFGSVDVVIKNFRKLKKKGLHIDLLNSIRDDPDRLLRVSNLPEDWTAHNIESLSNDILEANIQTRHERYGYVRFFTKEHAEKNVEVFEKAGLVIDKNQVPDAWPHGSRYNLKIENLEIGTTKEDILKLSGNIIAANVETKDGKVSAFPRFSSVKDLYEDYTMLAQGGYNVSLGPYVTAKTLRLSLPHDNYTEEDIKQLSDMIVFVNITKDQKGNSYATAVCNSFKARQKTYEDLMKIKGETGIIPRGLAEVKDEATLYLGGFGADKTKEELMKMSDDIIGCSIYLNREPRFAFLRFESQEKAEENLEKLRMLLESDGMHIYKKHKNSDREREDKTLYMGFPNADITEEDIRELSNDITDVKLITKDLHSYAFVQFSSAKLAEMNHDYLKGMGLTVDFKRRKGTIKRQKNVMYDATFDSDQLQSE